MRFKQGELVLFVIATTPAGVPFVGEVVEISKVGPCDAYSYGDPAKRVRVDYTVTVPGGTLLGAMDYQLRKLDPPNEPASLTRTAPEKEEAHA